MAIPMPMYTEGDDDVYGYRMLYSLGSGAFGKVYKVSKRNRCFAMKQVNVKESDQKYVDREIRSHEQLPEHGNIVRFVEHFFDTNKVYIVLEFCSGGTLNDYIVKNNASSVVIHSFMNDMALGIEHLHKCNIVHRDIKPDNVLLVPQSEGIPRCKISDFGLSRFCSSETGIEMGSAIYYLQSDVGTPVFIAPEVHQSHYTKACDIFSLGVVFCSLISPKIIKPLNDSKKVIALAGETLFYEGPDETIQGAILEMTRNAELRILLRSMLYVTPASRTNATGVVRSLSSIDLSSLEVSNQRNFFLTEVIGGMTVACGCACSRF